MSELKIRVRNRTAVIADCPSIYAGSANIDTITADLDDEWTGYTVSALFICGDDVYQIPVGQTISGAVLEDSGLIRIGLIGVNGTAKIATNPINFRLPEGASLGDNLSDSDRKTMMDLYEEAMAGGGTGGGGTGQDGKGIQSITRYYYRTTSSTKPTSTSGFTTTYTAPTTSYRFSWAYDHFVYTDGTTYNTGIFQLGVYGQTGPAGPAPTLSIGTVSTLSAGSNATAEITGGSGSYTLNFGIPKGQDGTSGSGGSGTQKGVASVTQYYLSSTSPSASSVTHSSSGWTTTRPVPTSTSVYIWTYTDITLEDGTSVKTAPILLGNYNERLGTISVMFLRNSSSTAPSTSASGWSTTSTEPTASQPYVWCYIRLTYYAYGTASSHYVNSPVFRLKTYQAPASSGESAGGMVLESNGCGGWQSGGTSVSGTDILSNVSKGVMPVMYISGFYAPVICVESTTQDGMDAIRMWYYYGGCSTPTLANTTVVV